MEEVMWVRKIDYPEELAAAIKACPNNAFVIAMQEFYVETGYLTPKQLMALSCVRPRRPRRTRSWVKYTRGGTWMEHSFDDTCAYCDGSNW